jgi:hypothetical protein
MQGGLDLKLQRCGLHRSGTEDALFQLRVCENRSMLVDYDYLDYEYIL